MMRTSRKLKFIAVLMSVIVLFQSCKVYHIQNVKVEEALLSQKRVKVIAVNNDKYFFKKLFFKEGNIYGVTKIHSVTAKKLDSKIEICSLNDKMAKIILDKNNIKEIYLQNEKLSLVLSILGPIVVVSGIVLILYSVVGNSVSYGSIELF